MHRSRFAAFTAVVIDGVTASVNGAFVGLEAQPASGGCLVLNDSAPCFPRTLYSPSPQLHNLIFRAPSFPNAMEERDKKGKRTRKNPRAHKGPKGDIFLYDI